MVGLRGEPGEFVFDTPTNRAPLSEAACWASDMASSERVGTRFSLWRYTGKDQRVYSSTPRRL